MVPRTGTPLMVRPLSARVVVEEADDGEAEVRAVLDLAQQQRAGAAGADDEHAATGRPSVAERT